LQIVVRKLRSAFRAILGLHAKSYPSRM
jgi:hypothetical protein